MAVLCSAFDPLLNPNGYFWQFAWLVVTNLGYSCMEIVLEALAGCIYIRD